jgi:DNA-binding SARP family transcriptional activator
VAAAEVPLEVWLMTDQPTNTTGAVEDLLETLALRLPSLDLTAASDLLGQLHARLDDQGDLAVVALLTAMDELVARWRRQNGELNACWRAHSKALSAESMTRRSMIAGFSTITELIPAVVERVARPTSAGLEGLPSVVHAAKVAAPESIDSRTDSAAHRLPENAGAIEMVAYVLGPFRLLQHGRAIDGWRGTKSPRIVRYLTARCGQPVHRERLIEMFWPDADIETGRRNLHQAIYSIRRALRRDDFAAQHILYENETYMINREIGFWCDVEEFEARVGAGRRAEHAGQLDDAVREYALAAVVYGGDLLEDTPNEDWAVTERDRLRLLHVEAANRRAELQFARGDLEAALDTTMQVLRHAPCDEMAHRRAMSCYSATGRRGLAVQQYRTCAGILADSLDVAPSPETTQLYTSLLGD